MEQQTSAERMLIIKGRIAGGIAISGLSLFCLWKGVDYMFTPRVEANSVSMDVLGQHLSANGLGGVIFGIGAIIALFAYWLFRIKMHAESTSQKVESGRKHARIPISTEGIEAIGTQDDVPVISDEVDRDPRTVITTQREQIILKLDTRFGKGGGDDPV